ncbi:sensor histidine kinase N-terminal domain-containing protein [Chitiniphilus purpureus]|uniref:histidine kinase n=1 Tax=Chitiniphilus purpureus TaxID=2981137 RepID=A0ABY6DIZ6_9NEIS|nr:sensor histidine kinase [Chitiniphilus sp. CD1]UXY14329.1 sensor histidine kinase N-terminal domain-containing protein [Chitiniphilus sp. CD1]
MKTSSTLRWQLAVSLLLPLLVVLIIDAILTYQHSLTAANAVFDRTLLSSAKSIADGARIRNGRLSVDLPHLSLESLEGNVSVRVFYRVDDAEGRRITGYDDLPPPQRPPVFYRPAYYDAEYKGESVRMIALRQPVHEVSAAQTLVISVLVGETGEMRRAFARHMLVKTLWRQALLILLVIAIVLGALHRGLQPLRNLSEEVSTRREDELAPFRAPGRPSELQPLVRALNQYVARIQRMLAARRRFFADAAHQLKTPLAVLRAQVELAEREPELPGVRQRLATMRGSLEDASRGVVQLLALARLENERGDTLPLLPLDLASAARQCALEWAPVSHRQRVDLGVQETVPVKILGNPQLLQELIGNLIDNAIRYAGAGSTITLSTMQLGEQAILIVSDNGPGIPEAERELVFQRFHRGSTARGEGSGLGLAIVAEIAARHQGRIILDETPGGGLTVRVCWPALLPES